MTDEKRHLFTLSNKKKSLLSHRYIPDAPINIYENLPVGTKLVKLTVTDRDIGDLVHYEFIGIQKEFSINEGIIIFVANHFIEYIMKCVSHS